MRHSDNHAALTAEVARFQDEVRRLALQAVRAVIREELDRKLAKMQTARPSSAASSRSEAASSAAPAAAAPAAPAAPASSSATTGGGRKRVAWTRDAIINELASWMASGTAIDAAFVKRYGPPGLVAATRRVFGRFDAALNVAGLHFSKLYPDGPPER